MFSANSPASQQTLVITNSITLKEFFYYSLLVYFKNRGTILGIFVFAFIASFLYINTPIMCKVYVLGVGAIFMAYLLFFVPVSLYIRTKRYYFSNKHLAEKLTCVFTPNTIQVKGESFSEEVSWNQFYKIEILNNWVCLYSDKVLTLKIRKTSCRCQEDFEGLNQFLKTMQMTGRLQNLIQSKQYLFGQLKGN